MLNFTATRTLSVSGAALTVSSTGAPLLHVRSISGAERLSEIYEYTLRLYTPAEGLPANIASEIDLHAMIGKSLTVTVQLDGSGTVLPGMSADANLGTGEREISGLVFQAHYLGRPRCKATTRSRSGRGSNWRASARTIASFRSRPSCRSSTTC